MNFRRAAEVACFTALLSLMATPSYAYIDPGLGSLIFQGAIAAFVAVAGAWAAFKMKVASFFTQKKPDDERDDPKK